MISFKNFHCSATPVLIAVLIFFESASIAVFLLRCIYVDIAGNRAAASIPMIAMTIMSSTRVKAFLNEYNDWCI